MAGPDWQPSRMTFRAQFEQLAASIFEQLMEPVVTVLREAEVESADIDEVVLVGGSTRIPKVCPSGSTR